MIYIEKFKNLFIKIIIILIILAIIIYNFFISQNEEDELDISNIIVETQNVEIIEKINKIKIYVTGEVNNPGVFEMEENSRIEDAINLAGGLTPSANIKNVNLAFVLEDGQKLYIPNINDKEIEYISKENGENIIDGTKSSSSKININKASLEELQSLPGVGASLAQKIITYRTENGKFNSIDDLKKVSGIGDKKFEGLKDNISI